VVREKGSVLWEPIMLRATIGGDTRAFSRGMTIVKPGIGRSAVLSKQETRRGKKWAEFRCGMGILRQISIWRRLKHFGDTGHITSDYATDIWRRMLYHGCAMFLQRSMKTEIALVEWTRSSKVLRFSKNYLAV